MLWYGVKVSNSPIHTHCVLHSDEKKEKITTKAVEQKKTVKYTD